MSFYLDEHHTFGSLLRDFLKANGLLKVFLLDIFLLTLTNKVVL